VHDDRELAERRIDRDLWERVLPLVHADRASMSIEAGPSPGELTPFVAGSEWGAPWQTTWFRFSADVPAGWDDRPGTRVEAVVDLGFTLAQAGFQAEGLVVSRTDGTPVQGIHPDRTCVVIEADELATGRVVLLVEAASNPTFVQFAPSSEGLPETASADPIYRFRTADLVLVDLETEALVHDLDVLDDTMRSLALADPRRAKIRRSIIIALDALPEVDDARRALATHLRPITLDGDVDGGGDGDVHGHAGDARRHRIIATGHAHIDTAWLWPIRETIRKCTRTFASAVGLMDDDPTFRFTCSQAQQYAWIEESQPALFDKIVAAAARGQWLPVGGMWVESDMNLPSGESLARQIVHGQRYFTDRFGAPCREMWIPDVFGYPAGLPQLFVAGGMDRFVTQKLSWNKQNRFPHHTFRWEGLDGTSVLTHFPPVDTYNAQIRPSEIAHSIRNFREHAWSDVSLMPFGHGDGGGGPTREMLERARRIADVDPSVSLEIGSVDDFFTAVEDEAVRGAPVPVWRGELYFETHRGTLTSQLRTKIGNRRCERLLVEAELWEAALAVAGTTGTATATGSEASALGGSADELMTLDEAWKQLLTQQFHDILPGSSIAWVHRDAEETFERVAREVTRRIDRSLAGLARSRPALANPSGVAISGVVVVADGGAVADEDRLASSGRAPQHVQRLADDSVAFAAEVPAFGIAPIDPQPVTDRVVLTDCSMTNGQLCVRWNKHGDITSIIDTVARREIVPPGALLAAIELAPDRPVEYDAWDLESWTREHACTVTGGAVSIVEKGPLVGRVRVVRRLGPSAVTSTYELRAGSRQLDVHLDIDWHHDEHLLSMAFPLDVRADTAACDVQFGVTHCPTHPSSPWDASKFEVCAHRYVSVAEPSFGVAVLNNGRYGHAVFDRAIRVSLARAAKYPDPDADHGRHEVRLAVRPHDGDLGDVRAAAELFNRPLRTIGGSGQDRESSPIVEIVGATGTPAHGVEVDAIKLADDESGHLIVRLHEAVGDRTRMTLRAPTRIGAAWRCDLMEAEQRGEEVGDGVLAIELRPFEIVTLRLALAPDWDGRT